MNFDSLTTWAAGVVLAAALTGNIKDLQLWVWRSQAKLLYESRSSTWGSPHFFGPKYHVTVKPSPNAHPMNQISKTTIDRKIHFESRSN